MFNKENFQRAVKIKGYGSFDKFTSKSEIGRIKIINNDNSLKVQPIIISNLEEYMKFINTVETSFANPVFYRGQTNADYLLTPNCLRINPKNENLMIEAFSRRFFDELSNCKSSMEKLVVMQHFQLPTRCLDISESPLMALYFACSHMKKFRKEIITQENEDWGEIILFQEYCEEGEKRPENLKSIESSNISVIANTAFMEEKFSLWHLGARWKKDVDIGHDERFINLRTIVRSSYIVRVPQNNIRIKNQHGAFIMANANIAFIERDEKKSKKLTEQIINEDYIDYNDLIDRKWDLSETKTWELRFKKIKPYSDENELDFFKTDPFDLQRLFYRKDDIQQVVLIPPDRKKSILEELRKLNITEDFVYPDMDNVANEISEQLNI